MDGREVLEKAWVVERETERISPDSLESGDPDLPGERWGFRERK